MSAANVAGPLRQVLQDARGPGVSMGDLTVLAAQNDPYRVDTPAGHRDGEWFAEQVQWLRRGRPSLYLRGIHYAISQAPKPILKPNGQPYRNNDQDWAWLQNTAAKAARWLGFVPFELIRDQRNDPPVIHRQSRPHPWPYVGANVDVEIPDAVDIEPYVGVAEFRGHQPYHLLIYGEKSSLSEVLLPVSKRYEADLYLMTGEISDTYLHRIAADAADDGRPLRLFTVADFDPSGHQMPISIGRKLQALRDLTFHELDFEVRPAALTVEQVQELGLPSAPLKETEKRADKWRAAFGVEQTEIDALAELQPDVLRRIVSEALDPFYDRGLETRVMRAKARWLMAAREELDRRLDGALLAEIRERAETKLAELKTEIDAINEAMRQAVPSSWRFDFPPIEIPAPEIDESVHGTPLISSRWPWAEQTRALIQRKSYGGGS